MWKHNEREPRSQENNDRSEQRPSEGLLIAVSPAHRDPDENQKQRQRKHKVFVKFAADRQTA